MARKSLLGGLLAPLLLLAGLGHAQTLPPPGLPVQPTDWFVCWQQGSTTGYQAHGCTPSSLTTYLYGQPATYTALQTYNSGISLPLLTSHGVLLGEGNAAVGSLQFNTGQILIGQGLGVDPMAVTLTGDATINAAGHVTVTGVNGAVLGTYATQNYATPPVIGGTTPNAGNFTAMTATSMVNSGTLSVAGAVSGAGFTNLLAPYAPTASPALTGNATAVNLAVSGTLNGAGVTSLLAPYAPIASPTFTGTVTSATHTNTGLLTTANLTVSGITGVAQCLQISTAGVVSGTGSTCGTNTSSFVNLSSSGTFTANVISETGTASLKGVTLTDMTSAGSQCLGVTSAGLIYATGSICGNGSGGVSSFNTRSGAITLSSTDVTNALGFTPPSSAVASFNTRTGAVTLSSADVTTALGFTPQASGTYVNTFNTRSGAVTLLSADVTGALGFTPYNAATPLVSSFNTRTGAVSLTSADVTGALTYTPLSNTGGTVTGSINATTGLSVGTNTAAAGVQINGQAGANRTLAFQTAGLSSWILYDNNTAQSGSNVGSDLVLNRYDDSGNLLGSPLIITRATGNALFADAVTVSGLLTASNGLTVTGNIAGSNAITAGASISSSTTAANVGGLNVYAGTNGAVISNNWSTTAPTTYDADQAILFQNQTILNNTSFSGSDARYMALGLGPASGGASGPSPFVRVATGQTFHIVATNVVDDGGFYASAITSTGSGTITSGGLLTANAGLAVNSGNVAVGAGNVQARGYGNLGQIELPSANSSGTWYNAGFRNDGTTFYLLLSAGQTSQALADSASWNTLRPLQVNDSTGAVTLDATGAGVTIGTNEVITGSQMASNTVVVAGSTSGTGNASSITSGYISMTPSGNTTNTGYLAFWNSAGVRQGYVGYATTNGPVVINSDTGNGITLSGGNVSMTSFTVTSDERLKSHIRPFTSFGDLLDRVHVYEYEKAGRTEWGVLAQELRTVAPNLVVEGKDEQKTLSVDYNSLNVAVLAEVKELKAKVAKLEAEHDADHALLLKLLARSKHHSVHRHHLRHAA